MTALLAVMLMQATPLPDPADFTVVEPSTSAEVEDALSRIDEIPHAEWLTLLEGLSDAGDASAQNLLGALHLSGDFGAALNPEKGCDYFAAIATPRGDALHSLAHCYWAGYGREQDYARARELYVQAIEAGYLTSLCGLGTMLVRGHGGPVDAPAGVALCQRAAELGDMNAQTDTGIFLLMGEGVERNPVRARLWLEEAGAQGQANAAYLLGQLYVRGDGVDADPIRGADWFYRAHEAGRPDAAMALARLQFTRGYRTEGDEVFVNPQLIGEAQEWAAIAATTDPDPQMREQAQDLVELAGQLLERAAD